MATQVSSALSKQSSKPVTLAVVIGLAVVGLTLVSMHGAHSGTVDEISDEARIAATMKVNLKVTGQLADTLAATSALAANNKARLDALTTAVGSNTKTCTAQLTAINNKVVIIKKDVDVFINSPQSAQSSLPYMMRSWKLAQPTQTKKNQLVGTFDFAGNNRFIIDVEFKFVARVPGQWSNFFWVGNSAGSRVPAVFLTPTANKLLIHQATTTTATANYALSAHSLVKGRVYKLRLESSGYAMSARLTGTGVDARYSSTAANLWVKQPSGEQKIWISDPWHNAPNVQVIRASIMTIF